MAVIRAFLRYALFVVLVVLVTAAGYAAVAAAQAEPIPTAPERPVLHAPEETAKVPQADPVGPAVGTANASTRAPALPRSLGRATVHLDGDTASRALGVAILDGESGALVGWQAMASGDASSSLTFDEVPEGEHWVALATDPRTVRIHYLQRVPLAMDWQDGALTGACTLSAEVHRVTVALQWGADDSELLPILSPVLRRVDDAGWRPAAGSLAVDTKGRTLEIGPLGAGRYSLALDGVAVGADAPVEEFDVPTDEPVTLRCRSR